MRAEEQTSKHLLLAVITTVFSTMLGLVTVVMAWEFWTIPLMVSGCLSIWLLHIAKIGSDAFYENLCAGLILLQFFFFGVHEASLYDIPAMACITILALFMLNKKWMVYAVEALYVLELAYHALILHTISYDIEFQDAFRLGLGAVVTFGGAVLAEYWIKRRSAQREWYDRVFNELETAGKQNAVFLSNVSHELRTPINMVIGISEVALGKSLSPDIRSDMTSIKLEDLFPVNFRQVVVKDIDFSDAFEQAVEAKMQAEQNALRAENEKQEAITRAEQEREVARVEAEAAILAAEGEARALEITREALENMPDTWIAQQYLEKWDGKLPQFITGDGTSVMLTPDLE